ncbi:MAG: RNA polymerase factor sigma-54 [Candidatus Omnitrophota bacterium]|nr:RNA polymerase factor sigma-54 [Candidatus Omnitrophota bacterium]
MDYKFSHQQKFIQKMSLTPQMRQSINMLGMSVSDLTEYIEFAATQNPFLQKILANQAADKYNSRAAMSKNESPYELENKISGIENPRSSLLSQIKMTDISDELLEISEYLIFEMDDNGYIPLEPEEAARDLGVSVEDVQKSLEAIQGLEPAGIGAQDITECLQLQLKRRGMERSLEYKIVSSYLAEVAREDIERITKALKTDAKAVKDAVANIKKLNPRPASTILSKNSERVIPELTARFEKNKLRLELNRGTIPGLKLYNPYENDFNVVKDPKARKFMQENINAAKNLIDNLKRREDTVCKVANYILNFQRDNLTKDKHDIKTLTIKDIARAIKFHPSTISRAVSHKYIKVNDKVISLNSLLSHGMKKENGEIQSKTAIKTMLEKLIKSEDSSYPLTDDAISDRLKKEGIYLSRRTVAKYRLALRILPAYLRKKVKSAASSSSGK